MMMVMIYDGGDDDGDMIYDDGDDDDDGDVWESPWPKTGMRLAGFGESRKISHAYVKH